MTQLMTIVMSESKNCHIRERKRSCQRAKMLMSESENCHVREWKL